MGVAGFIMQHPFTETLKDTLLLKFHASRFHVLTSFRAERCKDFPFSRDNTEDFFKRRMTAKFFEKISVKMQNAPVRKMRTDAML